MAGRVARRRSAAMGWLPSTPHSTRDARGLRVHHWLLRFVGLGGLGLLDRRDFRGPSPLVMAVFTSLVLLFS